ncbi:uncharacterized protein LOC113384801 [Ctenocephalides felis]|uniref:uncharacterized protein LOC113384801 n=1 Tax=Ctenocephalides felis TaxID=7515 RepID=UPI000E6E4F8B|nr:uncharacterized protein LOC113384801 [Ctenocephalides felis]
MSDITCRRCHSANETLGHVLGQCTFVKPQRIHRHNEIVSLCRSEFIDKHPAGRYMIESPFTVDGKRLKPDLILWDAEESYIVDVTVRLEQGNSLGKANMEKILKYECLYPEVLNITGATHCRVLPIVVGSRGSLPPKTLSNLSLLSKRPKHTGLTSVLVALRTSIEMSNRFLDG